MAIKTAAGQLVKQIDALKTQRQQLAEALAELDALFDQLGIQVDGQAAPMKGRPSRKPGRKPGRPAGSRTAPATKAKPGRKKGKRKQFKITAAESVLGFVKNAGLKGATSAEIAKHWKSEGRAAQPFITLGQLVKAKKLKKQEIKDGRGSRYTVA